MVNDTAVSGDGGGKPRPDRPDATLRFSFLVPYAMALLLLVPASLSAQTAASMTTRPVHPRIIDTWTIADGLPGSVTDVTESADGSLWVGTVAGFLRFDGESFDIYDSNNVQDLPSRRIEALAPAPDSSLWIFTDGGHAVRWSAGATTQRIDFESDALRPATGSQGLDADDFWAWRIDLVYRVRDREAKAVTSGEIFGLGVGARVLIADVQVSRTGEVWVASNVGLARLVDESWQVVPRGSGLPEEPLTDLLQDSGGRLWVATRRGISVQVRDDVFETAEQTADSLGPVAEMAEGIDGTLWVLHTNRLRQLQVFESDGSTSLIPLWQRDWTARTETAMHIDRLGSVWIGGPERLSRISIAAASSLGIGEVVPRLRRGVHHVVGDGGGGLWLGPNCYGLLHWDGSVLRRQEGLDLGRSGCVLGLMRDSEGALWIGEGQRATRYFDGTLEQWSWSEKTRPGPITPFLEDASGRVWIGAEGKVLRSEPDGSLREFGAELGLPEADVWSLAQTADGDLWVGQVGTVSRWSGEAFEVFDEGDGVPLGDIRVLHVTDDGTLWAGSYGGGIARFVDGRFSRITRANGLFDNSISAILEDDRHRLWLLGNLGVFVAPRAAFDSVALGWSSRLDGVHFGPRDGVPEGNGGSPAAWLDTSGMAWFATIEGLISLDTKAFPYDPTPPGVRISSVTAAHGEVDSGDPLVVPPGAGAVTVTYETPGLPAGRGYRYRYRMLGLNDDWLEAGSARVVRFAGLPPGRYEFQVMARNADGVWDEAPARVRLQVLHTWWQHPILRGLAALIVVILIAAYARRRINQAEDRTRRLQHEIQERAEAERQVQAHQRELEHMSRIATAGELASSLAHELNQPLTAIVGNAVASSRMLSDPGTGKAAIREALDDIAGDSRRAAEIIRKLRTFIGRRQLDIEELDLNQVVEETVPMFRRELEGHGVILALELSPRLPRVEADRIQLEQVLVNLVLNAIDALSNQPPEERGLKVSTREGAGTASILVSDTGPGIDEADLDRVFEPFFTTRDEGMGMGLAICSTIAEAHDGALTVTRNPDRGVTFELSLPLSAPGETT